MLKTFVGAIKKIYQALGAVESELLVTIRQVFQVQSTGLNIGFCQLTPLVMLPCRT